MRASNKVSIAVALGAVGIVVAAARPAKLQSRAASVTDVAAVSAAKVDTATFAGGCFWSMERPFDHTKGVVSATVGYTGGTKANPTYDEVGSQTTGHAESVQVLFDPTKVTYDRLLYIYWHNIDPITPEAQFCDHGDNYRTAIYYHNAAQKRAADSSKAALDKSGLFKSPIVTQIAKATTFWKAEEYHQHYADRNPMAYKLYRIGCGRDARLKQLWGSSAEPNVPPL
jgi:peptide-methionine (S)-S-oxide reductase